MHLRSSAMLALLLALAAAACSDSSGPDEGSLQLVAVTSGLDPDIGYLAAVDDGPWQFLHASGGALKADHVAGGSHTVRVTGVATNCELSAPATRTVTVPAGGMLLVPIGVSCQARTPRILFGSTRDGAHDLYTMDADGFDVTRLTSSTNNLVYDAAWSPDGSRIAYSTNRDGNFEIYVMNADGSDPVRLTSTDAFDGFPQWSPDGSRITFESDRLASTEDALAMGIYVMNADGSAQTLIQRSGENPRWSPDGSRIVFDDSHSILVMDADGSHVSTLRDDSATYSVEPAWSPDSATIVFVSGRGDGSADNIAVMDADGANVTLLTQSPDGVVNDEPDWSPDGTRIAFQTNRDGDAEIYVMSADGSDAASITADFFSDEYWPVWRP